MSRYPVERIRAILPFIREETDDAYIAFIEEVEDSVLALTNYVCEVTALTPDILKTAAKVDKTYSLLKETIKTGFPRTRQLTNPRIRNFHGVRHRLYTDNDLIMMDDRIVVPQSCRRKALQNLLSAHQGVSSMARRAKVSVYWPGIHSDIQKARDSCSTCIKIAPSQSKETLILTPTPEWPFQCICMDLFEINHHVYIVCVDRYSGWPLIYHLPP